MEKYILIIGAELLDFGNLNGIKSISPIKRLSIFRNNEDKLVFPTRDDAIRFTRSKKYLGMRDKITKWLHSEPGQEWISKQTEVMLEDTDWLPMHEITKEDLP